MGHTIGPWYWQRGCYGEIRLMSPKNGHCVVMDFVRRGMQGAQPRFSDRGDAPLGGILHKAEELDLSTHPDALLIAKAPDLEAALIRLERAASMNRCWDVYDHEDFCEGFPEAADWAHGDVDEELCQALDQAEDILRAIRGEA
jgi:hypothetical protein